MSQEFRQKQKKTNDRGLCSVAIITFNEEENLPACLESVVEIADEIVVLDSYSTDRTAAICSETPKLKFFQHPFDGHIQQKNRALKKCSGPWILCLDADERVSPELSRSLQQFLQDPPEDVAGVKFPRRSFHMHRYIRHGGWYPNARYRLIRKGRARWGGENPHDKILLDGPGRCIAGDLIHFPEKDLSDQVQTINQFSSIAALMRYNRGRRYRLWRLLLKPVSTFLSMYVVKRGFLDRTQGFVIAVSSAYSTFLKEAKLFEMDVLKSDKPSNLSDRFQKKSAISATEK